MPLRFLPHCRPGAWDPATSGLTRGCQTRPSPAMSRYHHPRALRSSDSPGRTPPGWSPRCPAPPGRCSAWAGPRPAECSGTDRSHPASRLQENVVKTDLNMGVSLTGCRLSSLARVWDKHCLMLVCPDNFQLLTKISAIYFVLLTKASLSKDITGFKVPRIFPRHDGLSVLRYLWGQSFIYVIQTQQHLLN